MKRHRKRLASTRPLPQTLLVVEPQFELRDMHCFSHSLTRSIQQCVLWVQAPSLPIAHEMLSIQCCSEYIRSFALAHNHIFTSCLHLNIQALHHAFKRIPHSYVTTFFIDMTHGYVRVSTIITGTRFLK